MAVSYVGGASAASSTSVTVLSVTCPTVLDGDYAVAILGHTSGTITAPPGFTLSASLTVGTLLSKVYTAFLTAADSGDTLTWTNSGGGQRHGVSMAVYRGTSGIGVAASRAETTSTGTHLAPTATSPAGGCIPITFVMERSSLPSATFTAPSGYALRQSVFGAGSGAIAAAVADDITPVITAGGSIGGGDWIGDVANATVATFTMGLVASTSTPITGTFTLSPISGTAPLAVTGTVAATGGTGTPFSYTYVWGDGTTTGPTSSASVVHNYPAGNYTLAVNNRAYVDVVNT